MFTLHDCAVTNIFISPPNSCRLETHQSLLDNHHSDPQLRNRLLPDRFQCPIQLFDDHCHLLIPNEFGWEVDLRVVVVYRDTAYCGSAAAKIGNVPAFGTLPDQPAVGASLAKCARNVRACSKPRLD